MLSGQWMISVYILWLNREHTELFNKQLCLNIQLVYNKMYIHEACCYINFVSVSALVLVCSGARPPWWLAASNLCCPGDWLLQPLPLIHSGAWLLLWRLVALALYDSGAQLLLWCSAAPSPIPFPCCVSPAHICQPFSGGMVFYFCSYYITSSLPRTLTLVPLSLLRLVKCLLHNFSGGMVLVSAVSINTLR